MNPATTTTELETRYKFICTQFDLLVSHGVSISKALAGRESPTDHEYYADRIFSKLLCHALTLMRILPTGLVPTRPENSELWDISSACALARALLEAFDALAYVSIEQVSDHEREFRVLLWKLHSEERRQEMLKLIGSTAPGVSEVKNNVTTLRQQLTQQEFFLKLDDQTKRKIERGEAPPFHLSHAERNRRVGVDHDYYKAAVMFLSCYVHTYPFSIHQLMNFQAGEPESLRLMFLPVQYATGFLAKAILGTQVIFGDKLPDPSEKVSEVLSVWVEILGNGISKVD